MSFEINANFYRSFKIGDNINYNFKVLTLLYKSLESEVNDHTLLFKPIIIINISIIEAVLHDFFRRVHEHYWETIPNISEEIISLIRGKKIDDFAKYIDHVEKHDFFNKSDTNFYECLRYLRALRNRIHIQDSERHKEWQKKLNKNEEFIFIKSNMVKSEKCLEIILKRMSQRYHRPSDTSEKYVTPHRIPWKEYYK